ncbi:MAG TPA: ankyrin repeat domain-containing protein [Kofleriaceae bacterium]
MAANIDRLIEAAEAGDLDILAEALAAGCELDARDRFGRTALMVAASSNRVAFGQRLIAAGAALEAHETTAEVRYYHGANARVCSGRWTLLHAAAQSGADDVIAWLLDDHGYAIDVPDHGGWTPLHVAATYPLASLATLELLLARGADPNAEDGLGRNSAAHARDREFLRRLLDAGAHPDGGDFVPPIADPRADVPARPIASFVSKRDREAVALLFERGAKELGDAVLHAAMFWPEVLPLLLEHASDEAIADALVDVIDDATFDLLFRTMRVIPARVLLISGHATRMRAMLARGVSPDAARDLLGRTALHLAAERGDLEIVKLLVEAGADPTALDHKRNTPRALAFGRDNCKEVARFLEPITRLPAPQPAKPVGLAAGSRVRHAKFGAGSIVRIAQDKATVLFDEAGEKTLVMRVLVAE